MSTKTVNCEEYKLFLCFKRQIDNYCERYSELNQKIFEKEKEIILRNEEFEEKKKMAYEVLDIINKDIEKSRKELEKLQKQCKDNTLRKNISSRKELKKFRKFLNNHRGWLCLEECKASPECDYCHIIFQINYSYSCNKKADINTFKKSILKEDFERLVEIWEDYKNREKWVKYDHNWIKKRPIRHLDFLRCYRFLIWRRKIF